MLVFGHSGITLGAAALLASTLTSSRFSKIMGNEIIESSSRSSQVTPTLNGHSSYKASRLTSLVSRIDIRLLLIGSLLPDIIDKPIGHLLLRDTLNNGRIFCHTFLFLLLITLTGLYLYRSRTKTWLLVLAFGTFTHLIGDQMWLTPQILLWPLYGFAFETYDLTYGVQDMIDNLLTNPVAYVPELVGAAILIWFVLVLVRRRKIYAFIKYGQA